jgi:hypothetical protein
LRALCIRSDEQLLPEEDAETDGLKGVSEWEMARRRRVQNLRIQNQERLAATLELPAEIGELVALESLRVERVKPTSIPPEIGKLNGLLELELVCNELPALPAELGELSSLVRLCVSHNRLASLPDSVAQLTNLASLDVSHNQLTELPTDLRNLPITELELEGNRLPSHLVTELQDAASERYRRQPLGLRMSSPVEAARAARSSSQELQEIAEAGISESAADRRRERATERRANRTKSLIAFTMVLLAGTGAGIAAASFSWGDGARWEMLLQHFLGGIVGVLTGAVAAAMLLIPVAAGVLKWPKEVSDLAALCDPISGVFKIVFVVAVIAAAAWATCGVGLHAEFRWRVFSVSSATAMAIALALGFAYEKLKQ